MLLKVWAAPFNLNNISYHVNLIVCRQLYEFWLVCNVLGSWYIYIYFTVDVRTSLRSGCEQSVIRRDESRHVTVTSVWGPLNQSHLKSWMIEHNTTLWCDLMKPLMTRRGEQWQRVLTDSALIGHLFSHIAAWQSFTGDGSMCHSGLFKLQSASPQFHLKILYLLAEGDWMFLSSLRNHGATKKKKLRHH